MGKYSKDKRDIYYRRAKELGYRARSAFKLIQIDDEFHILNNVKRAVDLCAAPGSWSQVLSRRLNAANDSEAKIVSVDLQPMAPIQGVIQIEGDITSQETANQIIKEFDGNKADLVVSDGAPDVTGMHDIDEYIQGQLILAALNITTFVLRDGGTFIAKIFRGRDISLLYQKLQIFFADVSVAKPKSSRNSSIEAFVVCLNYNAPKDYIPTMPGGASIDSNNNKKNNKKENNNNNKKSSKGGSEIEIKNYKANKMDNEHLKGSNRYTIKFVACGDLSGFDADASYPLMLDNEGNNTNNNNNKIGDGMDGDNNNNIKGYEYTEPVQEPIEPNYKKYLKMKRNQVFGDDVDDGSGIEDDIITARPYSSVRNEQIPLEDGRDDMKDSGNNNRGRRGTITRGDERNESGGIRVSDLTIMGNNTLGDDMDDEDTPTPNGYLQIKPNHNVPGRRRRAKSNAKKRSGKTRRRKDRKQVRNEVAFWGAVAGSAVVLFYLARFFYQTQQTNPSAGAAGAAGGSSGVGGSSSTGAQIPSGSDSAPGIDFRLGGDNAQ